MQYNWKSIFSGRFIRTIPNKYFQLFANSKHLQNLESIYVNQLQFLRNGIITCHSLLEIKSIDG